MLGVDPPLDAPILRFLVHFLFLSTQAVKTMTSRCQNTQNVWDDKPHSLNKYSVLKGICYNIELVWRVIA